ncbi:PPK2 family polyphosphate kinase [Parenemella sanctibonifatiensis]|uniref:Phosphate--nucleotide phosphotransferase n=1 Tax=Parenemella sanctibonifatiensis TaxID=2016505 RepID=A0A255ENW9_9ACTN|nr:PPK2 family polyphosphate kinase [Parenemella sanctibonifatiensis]OYN91162.1 phosphate--nucleotide phosphotransferase [Parenemella sanctibonifatiensis]
MGSDRDEAQPTEPLRELLRAPQGKVDLSTIDPRGTAGYPGKGKKDVDDIVAELAPRLSDLQEQLYAAGRADEPDARSVLVILQGLDTSGKGGVIRHAMGLVDPQGIALRAFKQPTKEELSHHFLWRIRKALPEPGMIGVFDRSQYEDVLAVRVLELVPESEWRPRFEEINAFEAKLIESGTTVIKCFLHISSDEQKERLAERLDRPDKYWKYSPGDIDTRAQWPAYVEAYEEAIEQCNTEAAPWFIVPSDRKWYRNWAVAQLLREHLEAMDLSWPEADFDVETEKKRLAAT